MYSGKLVFAQVMDHLPMHTFRRAVSRYGGNRYVKSFPCHSQFLCMAFAQLTYRDSLRDIEVCLRAQRQKLYHLGIRSPVSRNTLANANKQRNWRIYVHEMVQSAADHPPLDGRPHGTSRSGTVNRATAATATHAHGGVA